MVVLLKRVNPPTFFQAMSAGKRIFLIWADNGPEIVSAIEALHARGHKVVYWVGLRENTSRFKDIIFHDHNTAWGGGPAESIDPTEFNPPSAELVKKLHATESELLTMMDKRFDPISTDERKHIYYRMLGYWDGVIQKYQPNFIIFPTVPHTVYNYVIYALARMYGIPTVMFEDSWVSDRLLTYNDWREGSRLLGQRLQVNQGKEFKLDNLSHDLQEYYKTQTTPNVDATPIYMKHWKNKFSPINIFLSKAKKVPGSLVDLSIFRRGWSFIKRSRQPNLKKEYEPLQSPVDLKQKFLYLPLNFQPERTTSPQGDIFVDQIFMVEVVSAALPPDWVIYVKEHPSQWWLRSGTAYSCVRYPGYYRRLASLPSVKLAPIHTNSFQLMKAAQAVVTATGTAGWEAILRGKPVLIFGYPWYRDFPGSFRVQDVQSCRAALGKIKAGFKVDSQAVVNFLKSFDEATVHGYVEGFVERNSKLNKQESMQNIIQVLTNEVEKV